MSLRIVPTPIGHKDDFTVRGLEVLKAASLVVLEEFKESTKWLRSQGISGKDFEQLNEHSKVEDVKRIADRCAAEEVALITDCGTPGFADPGFQLISECRKRGIQVSALPGASSLMTLISLSSERLHEFYFRGFIPTETEARRKTLLEVSQFDKPIVLMDTPYRMQKMIEEICEHFPKRKVLFCIDLTQETEIVFDGPVAHLKTKLLTELKLKKGEFMVLIYGKYERP